MNKTKKMRKNGKAPQNVLAIAKLTCQLMCDMFEERWKIFIQKTPFTVRANIDLTWHSVNFCFIFM